MKKTNKEPKSNKFNLSKENARNIISVFLAFSLFLSIFTYTISLKPVQKESEIVELEITEGSYFNEIVAQLHEKDLIKSVWATKLYSRFSKKQNIAAGFYQIDRAWSTKEILTSLNETVPYRDITVQIDEGSWAKDIAEILEETMNFDKEALIDLWNNEEYLKDIVEDYEYIDDSIFENKSDKRVLLEGYLYPDTYRFADGSDMDTVTRRILDNFEERMNSIESELEASEFSIHDLLTLSSIVMYEAATQEDQQMVSGVFMNRIKINMPLQSSVTVCYVLYDFEDWTDCEAYKNQAIDNPYNTYVYGGLPIGPILNPSISAIENTLNYKEHDYLFFIADVYEGGDGKVYYTKTYQDHLKKEKELKNR